MGKEGSHVYAMLGFPLAQISQKLGARLFFLMFCQVSSVSMLHISGCFLFVFLSDTMAFDLERNPILQPLNKSKKVDLMLIANLFAVQVPLNAKKKKKKDQLRQFG